MLKHHTVASCVVALALMVACTGCRSDYSNPSYPSPTPSPSPAPAAPNTVSMTGMTFSPATITVSAGTTVTWKNDDGLPHTSTSDTGAWDTGNMAAGSSTTTMFAKAGTYPYHCTYHAAMGMKGTVIVQ